MNPRIIMCTVDALAPFVLLEERARQNRAEARSVLFVQSFSPEKSTKELDRALCLTVEAHQFDPPVSRG